MTELGQGFRVGQQVRLTITARVVEVRTRSYDGEGILLRLEGGEVPIGWIDPEEVPTEVAREAVSV